MPRFYVKTPADKQDPHSPLIRHTRHLYKDFARACQTASKNLGKVYDDANVLRADYWQAAQLPPEQPVSRTRRIEARLFINAT